MKSINFLIAFSLSALFLLVITSCERTRGCTDPTAINYNANAQVDNGSCQYDGTATFYFDQNSPAATVTLNGQSGSITQYYTGGAPNCGTTATGCANFTLPTGNFSFTATSALSSWSGNVTITANQCNLVLLPLGAATFWTASNSYGTITVNIATVSNTITSYFTSGIPACGASGCANFTMAPGTYNYTASSQTGANWNGSVVVTNEGCQTVQLQ